MDRITVRAIEAFGYHGVLPHERELGQRFLVDLVLDVDLAPAAASDNLADTIDYGLLADGVAAIVAGEPANLLETVAGRIADRCMAHARVKGVEVTLRKPNAPLPVLAGEVAVTLRRDKS